jgi:hypothetical protein
MHTRNHCCCKAYTRNHLRAENRRYSGSTGISQNNAGLGFVPAFCDGATGQVYRSCFANGAPAPIHLLDGLPDELVLVRNAQGRAVALHPGVIAGFIRDQDFYTREQAARFAA